MKMQLNSYFLLILWIDEMSNFFIWGFVILIYKIIVPMSFSLEFEIRENV